MLVILIKLGLTKTIIRAKFIKIWVKVIRILNQRSNNQQQAKYSIKDQINSNIKYQTLNSTQNQQEQTKSIRY